MLSVKGRNAVTPKVPLGSQHSQPSWLTMLLEMSFCFITFEPQHRNSFQEPNIARVVFTARRAGGRGGRERGGGGRRCD